MQSWKYILLMSVLLKLIYRFKVIPSKSQLVCRYWQMSSKVYVERQKAQNSQHNSEEQSLMVLSAFKTYYKGTAIRQGGN